MAWTSPITAITGNIITSGTYWNTSVKANFEATELNIASTNWNLLYASAPNTISQLALGTKYQHLRMNSAGTAIEWGSFPPGCVVYKAAGAQSLTAPGPTAIQFDTKDYDYDSMVNLGVHNDRITINTTGLYLFTGGFNINTSPTTDRARIFRQSSGGSLLQSSGYDSSKDSIANTPSLYCTYYMQCNATDYIQLMYYVATNTTTIVDGTRDTQFLGATLVAV